MVSGCKKEVFSHILFEGKVEYSFSVPMRSNANLSVVLYKRRGSLIGKSGIIERDKEIERATTSEDGSFSMKLKWLDSRDEYYVEIFDNNEKQYITSSNSTFSGYKSLEGYFTFVLN